MDNFAEYFWSRVRKTDGCWEWQASVGSHGYGQIMHQAKMRTAHRVAWELSYGPIPPGLLVCHTCDNRRCCNPAHLWLGTDKTNALDKVRKGRHRYKLTPAQSAEIRALYRQGGYTQRGLAVQYGVSQRAILAHLKRT